ncbi:MAG TPA: M55 family metallopeptidase [Ktedonobacterales bacterium]|jgi:D-amino peptidase|nr:M55 family metallopeptidase [Ktedonobacterales bacterium]
MRVMIWVDMEGIAGIEAWDQVTGGKPQYEEGRRLMTGEVNAAVRGAKAAGADDIIVVDCHGAGGSYSFKSLIPEQLEGGATYVLGHAWCRYIEPLKEGCDAALLVGAHAMAGTPDGVMCHTVSSEAWYNAWVNDQLVGESGIEAAICGVWDTPVVFVAGDDATCREVTELLGEKVVTAPVKTGLGRYSARTLSHGDACDLIQRRVVEALTNKDWPAPYKPSSPVTFTVELAAPDHALAFANRPGVEVVNPRKVVATGEDFWDLWDRFWYRA